MGTRDWYLMHYSNPFITGGQKHTHTPPHFRTCQTMPHCRYSWPGSSSSPTRNDARKARQWCKGPDDARDASKETSRETRGTRARKHCKGHNDARDASEAASQGRQRCKGGNDAREAIVAASSLSTRRAIIVILIVINNFFLVLTT